MIKISYNANSIKKTSEFDEKTSYLDMEYTKSYIRISIFSTSQSLASFGMEMINNSPDNIIVDKDGYTVFNLSDYKNYKTTIKYNDRMRLPYGYYKELRIVMDLTTEKIIKEEA